MHKRKPAGVIVLVALMLLSTGHVYGFDAKISGSVGMDLKIIHTPTGKDAPRYLDPHEADPEKVFNDDEYLRQYLDLAVDAASGELSANVRFRLGTNYLGTGFIAGQKETDKGFELDNLLATIKTPHLTATLGDDLTLGFTDYLYAPDGDDPKPYINGLRIEALGRYTLAVGQETFPEWQGGDEDHDIRFIALCAEKVANQPVNVQFGEAEILDPDLDKVDTIKVLSTDFDFQIGNSELRGDLAVNDGGQGYLTSVDLSRRFANTNIWLKGEHSVNFTGLQARDNFHNMVDVPDKKDHRERTGFGLGMTHYLQQVNLGVSYENYGVPTVDLGASITVREEKKKKQHLTGQYHVRLQDDGWRALGVLEAATTYGVLAINLKHEIDALYGEFDLSQEEDLFGRLDEYEPANKLAVTGRLPIGAGLQAVSDLTMSEKFSGFGSLGVAELTAAAGLDYRRGNLLGEIRYPLTGLAAYRLALSNQWKWRFVGVELGSYFEQQRDSQLQNEGLKLALTLAPNKHFQFEGGWTYDDKSFNVNNPGLKVNRTASVAYRWNERFSMRADFTNVQFEAADPSKSFAVEQTVGSLTYHF